MQKVNIGCGTFGIALLIKIEQPTRFGIFEAAITVARLPTPSSASRRMGLNKFAPFGDGRAEDDI